MTYAEAVAHLHALLPELAPSGNTAAPRRRFDLNHMRLLCAKLGDPQKRTPSILIAGTNGKGSTAATLASILTAAGYRTGLYTSPHLTRVNERIQLAHPVLPSEYGVLSPEVHGADGPLALREIPDARFAELYTLVDTAGAQLVHSGDLSLPPSFFERVTAVAFLFFAESRADLAVLEVGLGGRLDATNVVEPILSVLTDIALDHQEYLGSTIGAIAAEKCGILRQGGTLVTLPQHPEANQSIGEAAMRLGVRGISAADYLPAPERNGTRDPDLTITPPEPVSSPEPRYDPHQGRPSPGLPPQAPRPVVTVQGNCYRIPLGERGMVEIVSPLPGEHQRRNIALAIAAAVTLRGNGFEIPEQAILHGIATTRWPGRLEFLSPNFLLDVAHNPAGAWTLRSALATLPEAQPRTLLFSCLRDKDLSEMARILFPLFDSSSGDPLRRADHIVLAPVASPRAADVRDLMEAAHALRVPAHAAPHLPAALGQARQITPPGGLIVVTGSVYLVGELRELILAPTGH